MSTAGGRYDHTAEWLEPRIPDQGLRGYVDALRERFWLILAIVVLTTLAAAIYVATADKVYEADASLLITPVSGEDTVLSGLGLIRSSSDPSRDVETTARLVTTRDVAKRVQTKLNSNRPPGALLADVQADPVAQSDIVTITAEGASPLLARDLANGFAEAVVEDRTAKFHDQVGSAIKQLRTRIRSVGPEESGGGSESPIGQLARLETLRGSDDPTVRLETRAGLSASPVSPKPKLSILAGIFAGFVLGIGGAFALRVLDPRLRREEQLRSSYGLPVLARIPNERKLRGARALGPYQLSPATVEAYRTLRTTLAASRRQAGSRSVVVTGASPSEGKTTTSINLASSLALAGNRVVLIEADLRRPSISDALRVTSPRGIVSVLVDEVPLEDALVTSKAYGPNLQLLLADQVGEWMADRLSLPAAETLVDDAKRIADYVIIDSPPLTEVIDVLPLAQRAEDVLLVVRLGKSHLTKLAQLGELLARHDIKPVGFVLVGVGRPAKEGYYYTARGVQLSDFNGEEPQEAEARPRSITG